MSERKLYTTDVAGFTKTVLQTREQRDAEEGELTKLHARGIYTPAEAAQALADAHGVNAVELINRMRGAHLDGQLTTRSPSTLAPRRKGDRFRPTIDYVFVADVDEMLARWGVDYRFPRPLNMHGLATHDSAVPTPIEPMPHRSGVMPGPMFQPATTLPKETRDAIWHRLRILAPLHGGDERKRMACHAEMEVAQSQTGLTAYHAKQVAALFYPDAPDKAAAMRAAMEAAVHFGELPHIPGDRDGFFVACLVAWPECPRVPKNSPMREWLPAFMWEPENQAAPEQLATPLAASSAPASVDWIEPAQNQARQIIKERAARDLYPSQVDIADEIAADFRKRGIFGADGKPLAGATIKRHALKGISSATKRAQSTTLKRGK